jgi:hypothetical protein
MKLRLLVWFKSHYSLGRFFFKKKNIKIYLTRTIFFFEKNIKISLRIIKKEGARGIEEGAS